MVHLFVLIFKPENYIFILNHYLHFCSHRALWGFRLFSILRVEGLNGQQGARYRASGSLTTTPPEAAAKGRGNDCMLPDE